MTSIYRIRDTQRFIFLPLLFPLMPLFAQIVHKSSIPLLYFGEAVFIMFTFWLLFRERELEVSDDTIRIDSGRLAQVWSHEEIQEITLLKNQAVQIRVPGRTRYVRVIGDDYPQAVRELMQFTWRHAIVLVDKRPDGTARRKAG